MPTGFFSRASSSQRNTVLEIHTCMFSGSVVPHMKSPGSFSGSPGRCSRSPHLPGAQSGACSGPPRPKAVGGSLGLGLGRAVTLACVVTPWHPFLKFSTLGAASPGPSPHLGRPVVFLAGIATDTSGLSKFRHARNPRAQGSPVRPLTHRALAVPILHSNGGGMSYTLGWGV